MRLEKMTTVEIDDDDFIVEDEEELLVDDGDLDDQLNGVFKNDSNG